METPKFDESEEQIIEPAPEPAGTAEDVKSMSEQDYVLQHIDPELLAAATLVVDRILMLKEECPKPFLGQQGTKARGAVRAVIPEGDKKAQALVAALTAEIYRCSFEYRKLSAKKGRIKPSTFANQHKLGHVSRALTAIAESRKRIFTVARQDPARGLAFAVERIKTEREPLRLKILRINGKEQILELLICNIEESQVPAFLAKQQGNEGLRLEDAGIIAELFKEAKQKANELPEIDMRKYNNVRNYYAAIEYLYSALRRLYNETV